MNKPIKNWNKIYQLKPTIKEGQSYLYGFLLGKDATDLPFFTAPEDPSFDPEREETIYNALVIDDVKRENSSHKALRHAIIGQEVDWIIDRIETTSPDEAMDFFNKYNN